MALPKIETPTYTMVLPSREGEIKFRPFTVKEEKILMIAAETGEQKDMLRAMSDVIKSCTYDVVICDNLPVFDIEYIFLQLRAKSVGEIAKFRVLCPDDMKTYTEIEIDLTKVDVQVDDDHDNKVVIDEKRNLGVVFDYPTLSTYDISKDIDTVSTEDVFNLIYSCVNHIYEGDKIYPGKDSTLKEKKEFFESISQKNLVDIRKFFDSIPRLKQEVEVENPKTKVKSIVTLKGLQDFFTYASATTV
tara:strand:- start:392 stop:1129 length:738 start_codon:yes stop_codon:yes gene_type:complete